MESTIEEFRQENAKLLDLWREAQKYGWRLGQPKPYYPVGMKNPHPSLLLYTITPPKASDPRNTWAAIWKNVPVIDEKTKKRLYYISFPHWFENEILKERKLVGKSAEGDSSSGWLGTAVDNLNWMWDLAWSSYAEGTQDGFIPGPPPY